MPSTRPPTDPELSKLLQSWEIETRDDPALPSKVWRRIEASTPQSRRASSRWIEDFVALFARPVVAVSTVAFFTAAGAALAYAQHAHSDDARFERLVREYVQSIDPVELASSMPGNGSSHFHP